MTTYEYKGWMVRLVPAKEYDENGDGLCTGCLLEKASVQDCIDLNRKSRSKDGQDCGDCKIFEEDGK